MKRKEEQWGCTEIEIANTQPFRLQVVKDKETTDTTEQTDGRMDRQTERDKDRYRDRDKKKRQTQTQRHRCIREQM